MSYIQQFFTSRDNNANAATFVGQEGRLWWDPITNQIYSSDGVTPGGIPLSGGGGNGSPGGSNSQVQFNQNGNFGGSANLTFDRVSGALTAVSYTGGSMSLSGNISANYVIANNFGNVGNVEIESGGTYWYFNTDNTFTGNGNITAGYYFGNGSQLTGIVSSYGNSNVVTLLSSFDGNPISTTGNITAGYYFGNGSQLTGIVATNANTANYALTANTANTAITVTASAQPNITSLGNLINIRFNTGLTPITAATGQMFWDTGEHTVTLGMENGVQQQIGLEQYIYIKASEAISDGQAVMFTGATGDNVQGAPADTTSVGFRPEYIIGIATQDIARNGFGYVTTFGQVHGLNTLAYAVGDILWVDNATPGGLTNVQPSDPNFQIQMAAVTKRAGGDGHIQVRPTPFYDINRVTNVNTNGSINGQVLTYNGANSVWINANAYGNSNVVTLLAGFDGNPISTTGNISAGYFIGNGSHLTSITAANVSGNVANATYATTAGTAGTVTTNAQPNITSVGTLTSVTSTGNISTTGNVISNYVIASGGNTVINSDISTTGNVVATYFKGDGSLLVGIAPSVQVYEFANVSSGISTYLTAEWLANYTPGPVVDIPITIGTTPTYLAGFITQSGYPNITVIPVGTMAVSIVLVKTTGSKSYVAFAEIYKRDVSGTETLITTTDLSNSIAVNTAQQITLAAYFSTPVSLNATDRIVTKIYAYTSQGTDIITFRYEDNTGTGLQLPVLPASAGSFVPYNNPTANLAMGSYGVTGAFFSATGNITTTANIAGGNLIGTHVGNLTGTTVSATSNITGGNLITSGLVSATGNILGGNIGAGGAPNYYNLSGYTAAITIVAPTTGSAIIETVGSTGNAGTIAFGNVNFRQAAISSTVTNDLSFFVNFSGVSNSVAQSMVLYSNLNARFSNAVSAVGNITGGNLTTAGLITATGNISGGNLNATGLSLSGNVVSAINTTANITTTANISGGNILGTTASLSGNITGGNLITAGQVIAGNGAINQPGFRFAGDADTGFYLSGEGNILVTTNTGIRAAFNDSGISVPGLISVTGNVSGGNINTGGRVVASGNITGTANITGGNLISSGAIYSNYNTNTANTGSFMATGGNTKGGTGYLDFLVVQNTSGGATNPYKWLRTTSDGQLQIINSAYTNNLLNLTDAGALSVASSISVNYKQAVNGPAFSAYAAAILQTIPNNTQTKVLFQTEEFDTNSNYTNSRFTPTVEGYYQLNAEVRLDGASGTGEMMIILYKNGAEYKRGTNQSGTQIAANFWAMQVSSVAYANGTGDYFEIYVQQGSGGSINVTAVNNSAITWFNGCMLRGA